MGRKINREDMIGNCYQSPTWGKYCIMSYEGKTDNKHYYKIAFENGNEYVSHWDLIRKGRCEDSITKKANRAKANYIMQKQRARVTKDKQKEYKTFDFTNKTVLALDLSSTSTGWCILNQRGIKDFGSITFCNGKSKKEIEAIKGIKNVKLLEAEYSIEKRLELIFKDISELLNKGIDVVIIESVYLGMSVSVLKVLMQLQGFVVGHCLVNQVPFEKIMPSSWQNYHNLSNHRDEIKKGSIANAERIIKTKTIDDIADAINLGIYAVKNLNK
ncbi:hypothetical protein [Cetobacterium sp.]|uniref:hypothetical protein n=1 Tax=Cetobacterium sp. TaxID=2071632 RepID=UPI003F3C3D5F